MCIIHVKIKLAQWEGKSPLIILIIIIIDRDIYVIFIITKLTFINTWEMICWEKFLMPFTKATVLAFNFLK